MSSLVILPVTGSSGIPFQGVKYLEKKSYPGWDSGAPFMVTITPFTLSVCSLIIIFSGSGLREVSADLVKELIELDAAIPTMVPAINYLHRRRFMGRPRAPRFIAGPSDQIRSPLENFKFLTN